MPLDASQSQVTPLSPVAHRSVLAMGRFPVEQLAWEAAPFLQLACSSHASRQDMALGGSACS